jgi:hypothetical protein
VNDFLKNGTTWMRRLAVALLVALVSGSALAHQQPPQPQTARQTQVPGPIDPEIRARFSVVVTADAAVTARVYEYLQLVAKRNDVLTRFGGRATTAELELVLMFEKYPQLPWNRREIGTVNLKIDPVEGVASVEYCIKRCGDLDADLVEYSQLLDDFLRKIDSASATLARRYR